MKKLGAVLVIVFFIAGVVFSFFAGNYISNKENMEERTPITVLLSAAGRGFTLAYLTEELTYDQVVSYDAEIPAVYGDVEVAIYREESGWGNRKSFLYRAEFTLNGVTYNLSIYSDAPEDIYTYLDLILGEPESGGNQSGATLTDVLGFGVCRIEMEEVAPYQYMWHYYVKMDGEDVCVAEQFGYDGPETWSRDLDGDGVPELICNSTYGDGVESVIVYRNNNGIIEEGTIRLSYYEEKLGWTHVLEGSTFSLPAERYDPKQGVFTATDYYTRGYDDPVTAEFDDGLDPFEFYPFNHLPA